MSYSYAFYRSLYTPFRKKFPVSRGGVGGGGGGGGGMISGE